MRVVSNKGEVSDESDPRCVNGCKCVVDRICCYDSLCHCVFS